MTKKKLHSIYIVGFLMIICDLTGCFYDHEKHRNDSGTMSQDKIADIEPLEADKIVFPTSFTNQQPDR